MAWKPRYLVMHDYGGNPQNRDGMFNPYHALVFPDGSIRYRNPDDPYGRTAPHAFRLNPQSVGLSYAGPVGSKPTPQAIETLRNEAQKIGEMFPGIQPMSHGEAFRATKGTPMQASRDGRDLVEASWRSNVVYGPPAPGQETRTAVASLPVSQRGLTSYAGLTPSNPVTAPAPAPTATGGDVGSIVRSIFSEGQGGKAPFGFGRTQIADPLAGDEIQAPQVGGLRRRPVDMAALMQLAGRGIT